MKASKRALKDEADLETAQNSCCVISKKARLALRRGAKDSPLALLPQASSFVSQNVHFAKCNEQSKHNGAIKVV